MSSDVAGQVVVAAATLSGVLLTLAASEYRARRSQFMKERLVAAADVVANARATRRSISSLHKQIFRQGIPDCFRAEELADAGDSSLIGPVEQYRLALAAFDSARARVQLLYPERVSVSVDNVREAMNNYFTASSEQAFLREAELSSAIDGFVGHARGTLKS